MFADLYDAHSQELLSWLHSRTFSGEVAADLCAETFAVALEQAHRYDPDRGAGGAWLWGIARNLLRHYHRSEAVERRARTRLGIVTPTVTDDEFDDVDHRLDRREAVRRATLALDDLSPKLAAAVRLRVIEDQPYEVVAKECGCTEVAARARVSRGLAAVFDDMDDVDRVEEAHG